MKLLNEEVKNMLAIFGMLIPTMGVISYNYYSNPVEQLPEVQVISLEEPAPVESVRLVIDKPDPVVALAQNAYFEARGEGHLGMVGVTNVVVTRSKSPDFPSNIVDVIYQPHQFSWTAEKHEVIEDEESFKDALSIARRAYDGSLPNIVGNADHYYNPKVCNPYWGVKFTETRILGNHRYVDSTRPVKVQYTPVKSVKTHQIESKQVKKGVNNV